MLPHLILVQRNGSVYQDTRVRLLVLALSQISQKHHVCVCVCSLPVKFLRAKIVLQAPRSRIRNVALWGFAARMPTVRRLLMCYT